MSSCSIFLHPYHHPYIYMSADPVVDNLNPTPRANRGPAAAALVVARRGAPVRCPVSGVVMLCSALGIDQSGIPGNWNLLSENIVNSHLTAAAISANMNGMYCKLHKRNITWIIWTWTIFNCNLIGIEATLHCYMIWMKDDILVCRRSFNSYYDLSRSLSSVSVDQTRYKSREVRRRMRKHVTHKQEVWESSWDSKL